MKQSTYMPKQPRPEGPLWTATVDYKRKVIAEIARRGWSRAEFARAVKTTTATVSQLLGVGEAGLEESQTRLLPRINKAFGWPAPSKPTAPVTPNTPQDELKARLDAVWNSLDDNDRRIVAAVADRVSNTKRLP